MLKSNNFHKMVLSVLLGAIVSCNTEMEEPTPTFTLATSVSPAEGGTITVSPPSGPYTGQTVTLTPQPNTHWVFQEWEGDAYGSSNPLSLTMNANKSVTGVFIKRDYPLNINIEGEGTVHETIVTDPASREYTHGTTVEIIPVPAEGWLFDSWGGDLSGIEVPQRITVNEEKNITAVFKIDVTFGLFYLAENGITCKCEEAKPGDKGWINGVEYEAVDKALLIRRGGEGADMTKLCTSLVTDMSNVFRFKGSLFNQPLGHWDVSNVTNMDYMFELCDFNHPIGHWDVSKVTTMENMFRSSKFNQPIGEWDVSQVTNMDGMFLSSSFNQPIGNWNVGNVTSMWGMFGNSPFNQPIGDWDVSNVMNMVIMFTSSSFNQPIGDWDVGNVGQMLGMFSYNSVFNQDLSKWCVTRIRWRPTDFDKEADAWVLPRPVWGTCPI